MSNDLSKQFINGNIGGSMTLLPAGNGYLVRFQGKSSKTFSTAKYKDLESAEDKASEYRKITSDSMGISKNPYRLLSNHVEFKISDEHICKIDYQDFNKLVNTWCVKPGHNRFYAITTFGKTKKHLHSLIYPQWDEVDHINRDGLDNRRSNLRNGKKQNINVKNQAKRSDNNSGKTGVHFEKSSQSWKVQWPENGKRKKKSFTITKYGMEQAKQLAIQFRLELDKRLGINNGYSDDCKNKDLEYPKQQLESFTPNLYKSNTSGVHGIRFNGKAWNASWTVNGKRGNKTYSLKTYGDEAKELAIAKRLEMCPQTRS
jgi:hypothetical protein